MDANPPLALEELQYHLEGLRSLFFLMLLGIIATTLALDLCFFRKSMIAVRTQLDDQRPKVSKMVADYRKVPEPLIQRFSASMQGFAASNQDFQPILEKYRAYLPLSTANVSPATSSTPVPMKTK